MMRFEGGADTCRAGAKNSRLFAAIALCVGMLGACGSRTAGVLDQPNDFPSVIPAADRTTEWLAPGRSYAGAYSSSLTQINAGNVKDLGLAWHVDLDNRNGLEATPLLSSGILYTSLSWSRVIAIDARSGKVLWQFDPEMDRSAVAKSTCCDAVNRGVAIWQDKVYVGALDGRLIALERKTGRSVWQTQTFDRSKRYSITGAPLVVNGKVVIGNSGADFGVRGYFSAYDAETGKLLWRFYTVPGDPSKPYEHPELATAAKTWHGDNYWKLGGGGTVWGNFVYDPELDLLYVGTGNGSPWNRGIRSPGGGDNLFLSSILAINPNNGKLVWHYQTTPGESWDYTAVQNMILATLSIDGKPRNVLMQIPKNGFFYVLDRATGQLLSADKIGNVTWAERVDLKTGRPVENPDARYENNPKFQDKPTIIYPGSFGVHDWQPMSYNRRTGLVYIPIQDVPGAYRDEGKDYIERPGAFNLGAGIDDTTEFPRSAAKGSLVAWDPIQRKVVWTMPHPGFWNGGTLTTEGNLVFQGNAEGTLVAYAADRGTKLWEFDAQTGIVASPMTYELDGQQYVALLAGWGGGGVATGGDAITFTGVRNISRLLVFKLGGKDRLPPLPPAQPRPRATTSSTASPDVLAHGRRTFAIYCMRCHGVGAISGGLTPDLRKTHLDEQSFIYIVRNGLATGMPSFAEDLKPHEIAEIREWLLSQEIQNR